MGFCVCFAFGTRSCDECILRTVVSSLCKRHETFFVCKIVSKDVSKGSCSNYRVPAEV